MEIHVAKSAGFCFGVKRAVDMALKAAQTEAGPIYMLGDIVHNEHVVKQLNEAGIQIVESLEDIEVGTLLIRAHGAVPEVYKQAREKGFNILDATCPLVLEIHETARNLQQEGYTIVIIGDHGHHEVLGIAGQLRTKHVVATLEEARRLEKISRIGVVVQSTQNIENVQNIVGVLAGKCREMCFVNTICPATTQRQQDIRQFPMQHDVMIVIGSHTSANTCRLTEIARAFNPKTYQVESAADVQPAWFEGAKSVGVSAGASTPEGIISRVVERIGQIESSKNSTG